MVKDFITQVIYSPLQCRWEFIVKIVYMDTKKIYLTREGLSELKKEYDELKRIKRPRVVTRVSEARDMGDLSENAEYHAAREELSFIDGRIDEIEILLKEVVVIKDGKKSKVSAKRSIQLGSTVKLRVDGKQENYTVVGEWEADPNERKISHESPLGKALLGKKVGESIEVEAPAGKIVYKIVAIS